MRQADEFATAAESKWVVERVFNPASEQVGENSLMSKVDAALR
jgi:hypothetical protein